MLVNLRAVFVNFIIMTFTLTVAIDEDTILHIACRNNDIKKVKSILVKDESLLNIPGQDSQTPLMAAVLAGSDATVRFLLMMNADTSIGNSVGYTPLHGAGFQGRANIVNMLIDHGLDPLEYHADGYLAMHRACWGEEARHTATVRTFLERGLLKDVLTKDKQRHCLHMTKNEGTRDLLMNWVHQKVEL
jgi:ankyrin repeat protein